MPNGDTTAVVIAHDNVTLDLNGFSLIGPVDCNGGFPCANSGFTVCVSVTVPARVSGGR